MTMYEKYCHLNLDGRWIELEGNDRNLVYFCTPMDAAIIGWENNIHYCFICGYRDMVFAVNPESCADAYVYPLAMNFKDFLRLILSCGSTTAVEQIIGWSKAEFEDFVVGEDNAIHPAQQKVLDTIKESLKLKPMEEPYEYVKSVQKNFGDSRCKIRYSNEYYDVLGLERPDGTERDDKPWEFEPVRFTFVKKGKDGHPSKERR